MTKIYRACAPGSAMIMGEHAVLDNYPAIVAAVDYRITVTLTPRSDQRLVIHSQLGEHSQSLAYLVKQPPFEGIIACCQLFQNSLAYGFELTIDSQMSHQVGLGSSAAVIVATLAVLQRWQYGELDRHQLLIWAQQAMNQQQGQGSGADLAASIYGGILAYRKQPLSIVSLPVPEAALNQMNSCDSHNNVGVSDSHNATIDSDDGHKNSSSPSFQDFSSSFPRRRKSSQSNNSDSHKVSELETGTKDTINQTIDSPVEQQNEDCLIDKDSVTVTAFQFGLLYCGHKRPTAQVIQWLEQQFADQPKLLQRYYQMIGGTVSLAIDAWQHQDWSTVCQQIAINQRYMEELGLCHEPLVKLKRLCDNDPYIEAAKISGSGLGDCLLGLGDWSRSELRHQANYIPMPIAKEGVV